MLVHRNMAGLEVLYSCVGGSISCPQDAVVCFVHWEMIKSGYRCIGSGDEPKGSDKKSELLPADWNSNREELYSLRYKAKDSETQLLLKAISVDSTLIFNLMNSGTQQVSDLTVNISDHVEADQLQTFDSVFKDTDSLSEKVKTQLLPAQGRAPGQRTSRREEEDERRRREDSDPSASPSDSPDRDPPHTGADLDPFGSRGGGGMILDPLRSGYPRSGFDPSTGIPDILPPGAVPQGLASTRLDQSDDPDQVRE
ncbi:hypothetical protein F7725_017488 [Dissostichus mawsoni]|uniref:Proteasome inhibitor PI31 subunit n=1 Tax=Dissostichus mawsoni TaxID=36200 RepID=A0A7J5Z4J8_DISMA|nr:hypothetical protein F7725_017488 [Dissostichus mawsoni]